MYQQMNLHAHLSLPIFLHILQLLHIVSPYLRNQSSHLVCTCVPSHTILAHVPLTYSLTHVVLTQRFRSTQVQHYILAP
jgi:hypothetical protein